MQNFVPWYVCCFKTNKQTNPPTTWLWVDFYGSEYNTLFLWSDRTLWVKEGLLPHIIIRTTTIILKQEKKDISRLCANLSPEAFKISWMLLLVRKPKGFSPQEALTIPNNFSRATNNPPHTHFFPWKGREQREGKGTKREIHSFWLTSFWSLDLPPFHCTVTHAVYLASLL